MGVYKKEYFSNEVKDVVPSTSKFVRSRYDTKTRLRLNDNNIVIRNLKENDLVAPKTETDIVHVVTLLEDKRPDLIANTYYADARLYWIILAANGLRGCEDIRKGMTIRIPSKTALYGSNGVLK